MNDVPYLFADLTAAIEDLHGIAVEGQRGELSADMQEALLSNVLAGIRRLGRIAAAIGLALL